MGNDAPAKKVFKRFARVGGKRERGRPSLHWRNEVEEAVTKHGVGSWTMLSGWNPIRLIRLVNEDGNAGGVFFLYAEGSSAELHFSVEI